MTLPGTKDLVHAEASQGENFVQHRLSSLESPVNTKHKMNQSLKTYGILKKTNGLNNI